MLVTVSLSALQACKRGNSEVVRLLLEYGADCNILSKHKNTAMYFAKLSNNLMVCDHIKDHVAMWVLAPASILIRKQKEKEPDWCYSVVDVFLLAYHTQHKCSHCWRPLKMSLSTSTTLFLCIHPVIFAHTRLSSVAEDTIRAYFESRLVLLEPVFPLACHRLCEGPDFSLEFGFKSQPQQEGKTRTLKSDVCCVC